MKNKKEKNKAIYYILFGIIIFCIIYIVSSNNLFKINKNNKQNNGQVSKISIKKTIGETQEKNIQQNTEENQIPAKMGEYEVLGRLVIEKVNISKNILNVSNKESLKISAVKLYGPNINEIGNFCICGHNWKNMLKRVLELKVGDTFYLIDRKTLNRVNYQIYNIYTCMPKDLDCLNQKTDGKRETTIITCNPGGLTRLIIKGKEI